MNYQRLAYIVPLEISVGYIGDRALFHVGKITQAGYVDLFFEDFGAAVHTVSDGKINVWADVMPEDFIQWSFGMKNTDVVMAMSTIFVALGLDWFEWRVKKSIRGLEVTANDVPTENSLDNPLNSTLDGTLENPTENPYGNLYHKHPSLLGRSFSQL